MWDEEPEYDRHALAVAEGKQDSAKQDFLYVRLTTDGGALAAGSKLHSSLTRGAGSGARLR
jgi:hypothetical protein